MAGEVSLSAKMEYNENTPDRITNSGGETMKSAINVSSIPALSIPGLLLCILPALCLADGLPDLGLSQAYMDYPGEAVLFVMPDGSGSEFTQARTLYGLQVNATVHLELYDINNYPIAYFPWEDLWLESADNGLVACVLGTCADSSTDLHGQTQWVAPLRAGGQSQSACHVIVNGMALYSPGLPLYFNSPDLNGDLVVNLSDVSYFASDFFGAYNFRSDFFCDSTINIADLGLLAQSMSAACP